jgi:hypothetical protein
VLRRIRKANLLIRSVFTCDVGSGTFNVLKQVFITFGADSFTNTSPTEMLGGIGTDADATVNGIDNGAPTSLLRSAPVT